MSGAIRVDWQKIRDRWTLASLQDVHLFAFPKGSAQLFLAICQRLQWEATYRVEGYDFGDFDTVQSLVDAGIAGLMDSMTLQTLLDHVDEVESLLAEIRDRPCCDDGQIWQVVTDPDGIVQPEADTTGQDVVWDTGDPPGDAADWAEATLMRCAQAERFASGLAEWVPIVAAIHALPTIGILTVLSYAYGGLAAVGITAAAVVGAFSVSQAYEFLAGLRELAGLGPDYGAAEDELNDPDVINEIVCAIITSSTAAEAENAIDVALAEHAPTAYPMIRLLPLRWALGRLFNLDVDASGFGGPCRECIDPAEPTNYCLIARQNISTWRFQHSLHVDPPTWVNAPLNKIWVNTTYRFRPYSSFTPRIGATVNTNCAGFSTAANGEFRVTVVAFNAAGSNGSNITIYNQANNVLYQGPAAGAVNMTFNDFARMDTNENAVSRSGYIALRFMEPI